MGAPLGPAARSWKAAAALLGAVLLLALAVITLPRIALPDTSPDHRTFALFGRPAAPGGWVAGDGSYPVTLPDGRVAWLFGDSLVRNAIVVQDRRGGLRTLTAGSAAAPSDLIPPARPGTWLWPSGGFVEGGRLLVFAEEFALPLGAAPGGNDAFQFQATHRRYLVPFQLPALTEGTPREVYGGPVAWGHAVLVNRGWVYVYGNLERDGWTNLTYLARFPLGQSSGYWQFWQGSGFGPDPLAAAPLAGPGGKPLVAKLSSVVPNPDPAAPAGAAFAAFTINPFGSAIDLRVAPAPQGPWSDGHPLYTVPEQHPYLPRAQIAGSGTIQLAYSVPNSRPRYLTARW
jgi:hypothetical protein